MWFDIGRRKIILIHIPVEDKVGLQKQKGTCTLLKQ
jgi:hypothetical protein